MTSAIEVASLLDEGYGKDEIERELGIELCKRDGCVGVVVARRGPFAGLCDTHREEKRKEMSVTASMNELARRAALADTVPAYVYESQQRERTNGHEDAPTPAPETGPDDANVGEQEPEATGIASGSEPPERAERLVRKDEIITHLHDLYRRLQREPTARDIDRAGVVDSHYVIRRFGSVGMALQRAGIVDNPLVTASEPEKAGPEGYTGPADREPRDFRSDAGKPLSIFTDLKLDPEDEDRMRLVRLMSVLDREAETLDLEVLAGGRGNSKPAVTLANVPLSRGAKLLRLAEALARKQDRQWWKLTLTQKRQYVLLADRALEAMELVEYEHDRMLHHGARL